MDLNEIILRPFERSRSSKTSWASRQKKFNSAITVNRKNAVVERNTYVSTSVYNIAKYIENNPNGFTDKYLELESANFEHVNKLSVLPVIENTATFLITNCTNDTFLIRLTDTDDNCNDDIIFERLQDLSVNQVITKKAGSDRLIAALRGRDTVRLFSAPIEDVLLQQEPTKALITSKAKFLHCDLTGDGGKLFLLDLNGYLHIKDFKKLQDEPSKLFIYREDESLDFGMVSPTRSSNNSVNVLTNKYFMEYDLRDRLLKPSIFAKTEKSQYVNFTQSCKTDSVFYVCDTDCVNIIDSRNVKEEVAKFPTRLCNPTRSAHSVLINGCERLYLDSYGQYDFVEFEISNIFDTSEMLPQKFPIRPCEEYSCTEGSVFLADGDKLEYFMSDDIGTVRIIRLHGQHKNPELRVISSNTENTVYVNDLQRLPRRLVKNVIDEHCKQEVDNSWKQPIYDESNKNMIYDQVVDIFKINENSEENVSKARVEFWFDSAFFSQ